MNELGDPSTDLAAKIFAVMLFSFRSQSLKMLLLLALFVFSATAALPPAYNNVTLLTELFKKGQAQMTSDLDGSSYLPTIVRLAWHDSGCYCPMR